MALNESGYKSIRQALKFPNVQIKFRLITAAIVFGAIAIAYLVFIGHHTNKISEFYEQKTDFWDALYRIQELNSNIAKKEAFLEPTTEADIAKMDSEVAEIESKSHGLYDTSKFHSNYLIWKLHAYEAPTSERRNAVHVIEDESSKFEELLIKQEHESKENLTTYIRRVKRLSTWIGMFFLSALMLYVVSMWYTLIPDMNALVIAAREFKNGNLDYRIPISGKTETVEVAQSFHEMAQAMKKTNQELKELSQLKTDFVSTVSHELRTPLTAIKGSLALILGGIMGPLPSETQDMLKITEMNTDRLIRLINDILDIAKIEAGAVKLNFSKESISEVISQSIRNVETLARAREVNLVFKSKVESPLVVVDKDRLEQILLNLVSNAIKFTDSGGSVTVEYEYTDHKVLVHVIDTGRGMPEEFLKRAFQKFQQADHSDNKNLEGTGLGLAIVKGLVEGHGGEVTATSQLGVGSHFIFTIPWNGFEFALTAERKTGKIIKKIAA